MISISIYKKVHCYLNILTLLNWLNIFGYILLQKSEFKKTFASWTFPGYPIQISMNLKNK